MKKLLSIILALTVFTTILVSCSSKTNEQSNTTKKETVKNESKEGSAQKVVAVLPPGITSPFHSMIAQGAQKAASEQLKVEVQAPEKESDFAGQVSLMDKFVKDKVSGISVNAISDKDIVSAVKNANTAKIPVFVHNSLTPLPAGEVTEYIGYNQRKGGQLCGEYAAKLLNGKGKVFILDGLPGFHQIERSGGFLDALKKYPDIKVVGQKTAEWSREKAIEVVTEALKKDPDIKLFFGDSDEMAIGTSIAAKKLKKEVFTVGIDGNTVTLDEIEKGNVTATLGVFPDKMGEQIIKQMQQLFDGKKIPAFLETPSVVVDKTNLANYKSGSLWTDPIESSAEQLK